EPGRLRAWCRRFLTTDQFLATGAEPVGDVAVCAQHEWRRRHGRIRYGCGGRVLSAQPETRGAGTDLRTPGSNRGAGLQRVAALSHGRLGGPDARTKTAGHSGSYGSVMGNATGRAAGDPGPAQCCGAED